MLGKGRTGFKDSDYQNLEVPNIIQIETVTSWRENIIEK